MAEEKKTEETKEEVKDVEAKEEAAEEKKEEASADAETKADDKEESKSDDSTNEAEEEYEVPEKFKEIIDKVAEMTVVDLADLVQAMEKKFGVSAAVAAAGPAAGGAEEKSEYNVIIKDAGGSKINVIKEVKAITGLGLKEAKDIVDGAPGAVKEGVPKEEAEEMKKKLEEAGATIELE